MKICVCTHQNADTEDYCVACGAELKATSAPASIAASVPAAAAPVATQPAARTLTIGDKAYPLYEGKTVTIARADSGENPDIKLDDDSVSGTALHITVANGKLSVRYGGADEKPYSVVKNIKPGQAFEVEPGEMMMLGNLVGVIT